MPRVTQEQAKLNRQRVVETAAMLLRERGLHGVGVADIMKAAGLTHGGFYGQFENKDALAAEAFDWALQQNGYEGLQALVSMYLDARHVDAPGFGCPIAALANDVTREDAASPIRQRFTQGLRGMADMVGRLLPEGPSERRRRQALASISTLVGAVTLARAVNDPALRDELLEAARSAALPAILEGQAPQ